MVTLVHRTLLQHTFLSRSVSACFCRCHFDFFEAFLVKGIVNGFFQNNQEPFCKVQGCGGSPCIVPSKPLHKCDCGRVICVPGNIIRFVANEGPTAQIY